MTVLIRTGRPLAEEPRRFISQLWLETMFGLARYSLSEARSSEGLIPTR